MYFEECVEKNREIVKAFFQGSLKPILLEMITLFQLAILIY